MTRSMPDLSTVRGVQSILIIRHKALGDIALSFPIVRAMRARFPSARIVYLCWDRYKAVLAGEKSIDEVIGARKGFFEQLSLIVRLRRARFDVAIDLLSSPRSALLTLLTSARIRIGMDVGRHSWCYHFLLPRVRIIDGKKIKCYTLDFNHEIVSMLNIAGGEERGGAGSQEARYGQDAKGRHEIGFPVAEAEQRWVDEYLEGIGIDQSMLIGVVPAASYRSKAWPQENFISVMRSLKERYGLVSLVLWGPGEEHIARSIARSAPGAILAPDMGISRLGALISRLRLLVGVDSGPKHLAVIQGVPTVTLFGPTDPVTWDPMDGSHRALYLGLSCSPCRKRNCESNICLSDIQPEDVVEQVADLLGPAFRVEHDMGDSV